MPSNPHPLSLDAAIKLLTSAMQNPKNANICAIRIGVAADRIDQALESRESASAKIKFAKSYPELLRVGIKFITHNHSPQEHVAMVNRLVECRCDFAQARMRQLHKPGRYRPDGRTSVSPIDLIFDAITTVSNLIVLALSDLTQHKFRTGNANNGEKRWPQDPEDLLPFGPEGTVAGLEHWVAGPPSIGYIVFKLAGSLAVAHVPIIRELFQYPKFTFALARPARHLEAAVQFYDEGDPSPPARTHFFKYPVMTIFQFFDTLMHCDTPQFNIMVTARGMWLKQTLARLTVILADLPQEWSKIRVTVNYLTSYANAEIDPKTGVALLKFERSQFAEILDVDGLERDFKVMVETRKAGCWNISCTSASEVIHSRLCSKCNLIRFCGEKCQKEAWKCAILPHKSVCAKIYSLKGSLGTDNWPLLWTPDFTYVQFRTMCETKAVDTELVSTIANTISALRIRKNGFLHDMKKAGESQVERLQRGMQEEASLRALGNIRDRISPGQPILGRDEVYRTVYPQAYDTDGVPAVGGDGINDLD